MIASKNGRPQTDGGMRAAALELRWEDTPLGPFTAWPPVARAAVDMALSMAQPACVCWGSDARLIYNDLYRTILGNRHPWALGKPLCDIWPELEPTLRPALRGVFAGEAQLWEDAPFELDVVEGAPPTSWFTATWTPIRLDDGTVGGFLIVATDTTRRHAAEAALQSDRERQGFLLELADTLRPMGDANEIQLVAAQALGQRLGANRVGYAEDLGGGEIAVVRNYVDGVPGIEGRYRYDDYGPELLAAFRDGRTVVRDDIAGDPGLTEAEKAAHEALALGATVNVPLLKDGELRAVLFVHFQSAHRFDEREIALMGEVAERTWAEVMRARAEQETRRSEERYRTLFSSMDEGYCIIQILYDADGVADDWLFIEVNPAFEKHNGLTNATGRTIKQLAPGIERRWIEIYDRVAQTGESLRFQEPSGALEGRIFDLYAFRVGDPTERKVAVLFTNITEAKRSAERQAILLAEVQHRVRNTLAMIRTISDRTLRGSASLEEFAAAWRGRLAILARVQALLTRSANTGIDLASIVREELAAQASDESLYQVEGPDLTLPPKAAEVVTLAVHELATNALKHGALSVPDGRIEVSWSVETREGRRWLSFLWREQATSTKTGDEPERRGFGRELIERRVPYDLQGESELLIGQDGAACRLAFPLMHRASVLETGVPDRGTVFDEALDEAPPDLSGQRILLLEDDFLLASEAAQALQDAGAQVLGPFSAEEAALAAIDEEMPTSAVLDVNLGRGPSLKVARALKTARVPFVFLTGYDDIAFPPDLLEVKRLKKPAAMDKVIQAVASSRRRD
ncbi:HWE histidine kinase domain-containing protein [Caulobacter endophyticus]|uniref:histidine kinase n=1 Tax=Caulobacter endophyticus TaxID=2172652 RepID=A0A2T9JGX2_9CAUL|nr:HWE histidine kinase domain-containing protein [Caulobacter endophyticus]PVM82951.1 histidine kinase [Caulobacter endophyticus]